jgi:hypothetical protein
LRRVETYCGADLDIDGYYTRRIAVVDRDKDCCVAYECPDRKVREPRALGEVLTYMEVERSKRRVENV